MHVAYVVSFAFPNMSAGTRRVIGISQALVHAGIDVTIYSAGDGNGSAANLAGLPNNVSVFYTHLRCVHVHSAQPTPSTASPLPCETHPAQRPFITLVND